uniref:Proteasome subunit beta n=1 Tax=Hemiselmis andersenii TaxID=464988 RepID=A0A6U5BXA0_HEMAN
MQGIHAGAYDPRMPAGIMMPPAGGFSAGAACRSAAVVEPKTSTQSPIVTGTGVVGIKFDGGVMLAADTLGSYGSLARYLSVPRLKPFGKNTVVGGSGDLSDFQRVSALVDELIRYDDANDDGCHLSPSDIHSYLGRVMYNRRNRFDPLWNELVVAGYKDGESFLGFVDLIGTMYKDDVVATGFASYIATPLLRKAGTNLSKEAAKKALEDCLRVLFYRNTKASTRIQVATITEAGIDISEPYHLSTYWGYKAFEHTEYHGHKK